MMRFWLIVIFAIGIRLAVMPISLHGDLLYVWSIPTLALQGIWDPYRHAARQYPQIAQSDFDVYYPPLSYVAMALLLFVLSPFSSTLVPWLVRSREFIFSLKDVPLHEYIASISLSELRMNILLLKMPYLLFEVVVLWALTQLVPKEKKLLGTFLWLFNPLVIYTGYLLGQIDMMTVAFILLALVFSKKGRHFISMLMMILGSMVKTLPLFLIPPFVFLLERSWMRRFALGAFALSLFFVLNTPWMKEFPRLRIAYFPSVMSSVLDLSIRIDAIIKMIVLIASIGVMVWFCKQVFTVKHHVAHQFPYIIGAFLMLFFSAYRGILVNHWVIVFPFLLLRWMKEPRVVMKSLVFSVLVFVTQVYTRPLQSGLFLPLGIESVSLLPSTREILSPVMKYEHISLVTSAVLSGWMLTEVIRTGRALSYGQPNK